MTSVTTPNHPVDWRVPEVGNLQVELLYGASGDYDSTWANMGRHAIRDDFSRLYVLDNGSARISPSDGIELELCPGFMYLIPAGRSAKYRCLENMRLNWLHFRIGVLPMVDLFARWEPPWQVPCDADLRDQYLAVVEGLQTHTPQASFQRVSRLLELLLPFLPERWDAILPTGDAHRRLRPTVDALVRDIARPWTLKELARIAHLHPTYYSNLFRETYGMPPIRYLGQLRIRRARELLPRTDLRISDIAEECGFANPLHFSRAFRQASGICPRDFRARGASVMP